MDLISLISWWTKTFEISCSSWFSQRTSRKVCELTPLHSLTYWSLSSSWLFILYIFLVFPFFQSKVLPPIKIVRLVSQAFPLSFSFSWPKPPHHHQHNLCLSLSGTVKQQLDDGVRMLTAQGHNQNGVIQLCHTS